MFFSWDDSRRAFTDAAEWFVRTAALVGDRWNRPGLGEWDVRAFDAIDGESLRHAWPGCESYVSIAGDGFGKRDVQKFIWERAAYRMKELPEETFQQRVKRRSDLKLTRESVIPVTDKPEDIMIVVAGGDGSQSQYIHVWGQSTPEGGSTRSVTKAIRS